MTLPSIDDLSSVGGVIQDYRRIPDPTVERTAAQENQIAADAIMATRTLTRAYVSFVGGSSPLLSSHEAVWGTGTAPVVTHTATGTYSITWPATVTDALGASQYVALRAGWGGLTSNSAGSVNVNKNTANSVTVYTFDASGTLNDLGSQIIQVFVV